MAWAEFNHQALGKETLTVLIVTQHDLFYIPYFFRSFLRTRPAYSERIVLKGVVIQPSFCDTKFQVARRMLEFYGWGDFLRLLARYNMKKGLSLLNVLNLSDEPVSIAAICRQHHVPVRAEANVNSSAFIEAVRMAGIDLIVSVSAPQIFQQPLLQSALLGCINIHNGRLPDYRGMLPNFWQMLNGEVYSTITIHAMERKLDAGAVLWEERTPILPDMTLDTLIRKTKEKSAEALWRLLERLAHSGISKAIREFEGKGKYYSFPKSHDADALRQKGHALL